MKIAYFSPLNPVKSGISDYSEELIPHLMKHIDLDVFIDDGYIPEGDIMEHIGKSKILNHSMYVDKKYDVPLYHIGNNQYHGYMYPFVKKYPGVTVLHDLNLHGLVWNMTINRNNNRAAYLNFFYINHGITGVIYALNRFITKRRIDAFAYPMNREIIKKSRGIIVHSHYLRNEIKKIDKNVPVAKINMCIKNVKMHNTEKSKELLGLDTYDFVISTFGHIERHKRIDVILKTFSKFLKYHKNSIYVLVGERSFEFDVDGIIKALNIEENVRVTGYTDLQTFYEYINASDLCINLRYPSAGETSSSLLRIMDIGKPVMISDYHQFAEFPDECCIKVRVDMLEDMKGLEEMIILESMLNLYDNKRLRDWYGRNAKKYVIENHSWSDTARDYIDFLEKLT